MKPKAVWNQAWHVVFSVLWLDAKVPICPAHILPEHLGAMLRPWLKCSSVLPQTGICPRQ